MIKKICKECERDYGLTKTKFGYYLCTKHYTQLSRHGKILKRTRFDPNEFILHKNYAEMLIYDKDGNEKTRILISLEDVEKVKPYKWQMHSEKGGYIASKSFEGRKKVYLHRYLLDAQKNEVVDHINHDTLDNRRCNLRKCSYSQNMMNTRKPSDNTSGYKGVSWNKCKHKWEAYIQLDRKKVKLGCFVNKEDAISARIEAETKYYGEFSSV